MAKQIKKANVATPVTPKKVEPNTKAVESKKDDLNKDNSKMPEQKEEEVEDVLYNDEAQDAIYERVIDAVEAAKLVDLNFGYVESAVPEKVADRLGKDGIIVGAATQESGLVKTQISW